MIETNKKQTTTTISKVLCHQCIGDEYLKNHVNQSGKRRKCSYCNKTMNSILLEEMTEFVNDVFDEYYVKTPDEPTALQQMMISDKESEYSWEREGEPVIYAIMNSANIPESVARDIQEILSNKYFSPDHASIGEETEFSEGSYYIEKEASRNILQREWHKFEMSLKSETRFVNHPMSAHLGGIFSDIDQLKTLDGRPLVVDAGPDTKIDTIYRARVFQSDEKLITALCLPTQHLGPPPMRLALAGRMNAQGISVFYGANDPTVAITEVRPPVGSQVVVALFQIIRPLRLLDLTALKEVKSMGSLFDPQFQKQLKREEFLRSLSEHMTRPVMPDDEAFDYLPTQFIADFLATSRTIKLDGILFPSTQSKNNARNIVLFHKSAKVHSHELPIGTKITAQTCQWEEDGLAPNYHVYEEVPPPQNEQLIKRIGPKNRPDTSINTIKSDLSGERDRREPSLRIIPDKISVHIIQEVKFTTKKFDVSRTRSPKRISQLEDF